MPLAITYRTADGHVLAEETQPLAYQTELYEHCWTHDGVLAAGHLVEVRWLHKGQADAAGRVAMAVEVVHQAGCPCACE